MSHATFSLPHIFLSSHRPSKTVSSSRHMNPSVQFPPSHNVQVNATKLLSTTEPGVHRTIPYLLAARGSSVSRHSNKHEPLAYSSSSSSSFLSSFPPTSRGNVRMAAPAAQAGHVGVSSGMHRKSRATCTLSLAHASAVRTTSSTNSGTRARSDSTTAEQGSVEGSVVSIVNQDMLDQAQALKDAAGDATGHIHVEVESVIQEDAKPLGHIEGTTKAIPIPSRPPLRTKKSHSSMVVESKQRQGEVNLIPFPSTDSFAAYVQGRTSKRERSGSVSSSYSSTSTRSSSSSSSSSSSGTSRTSSSSSPPHALLRTSPPLSYVSLASSSKRSRRGSGASIGSFQSSRHSDDTDAPQQSLTIDTSSSASSMFASGSAIELTDDQDLSSPSSATSSASGSSSSTVSDADPIAYSPVKNDLKAKSTLALTMETTPPPPYSLLPPPYSPLFALAKEASAKAKAAGAVQPPRPRRPLPNLPAEPVEAPIPAEVTVIHAPVPRAAFVRIEANGVPNVEGLDNSNQLAGSVSLPPISPPAQPPRVRARVPVPALSPKPTTSRRSRVSTGELKVLLTLYRTVVFGLESRYLLEGERSHSPSIYMDQKEMSPRFPLVEEEEDSCDGIHTPHSSPSTSPSAPSHFPASYNPSSCSCASSCASPSKQALKEAKQKAKAKQAADNAMDVQDALLAIRLRGILRANGISEAELDLRIHTKTQDGEADEAIDPRSIIVVEDDGGDVDPFAEFGVMELDSADSTDMSPSGRSSMPERPLKASPPPLSKSTSKSSDKAILAPNAAYMIALLTMRFRYGSVSRRQRLIAGSKKNGAHAGGRQSKLNIAAWIANSEGDVVEQEDTDFDSYSVVDWYI